MLKLYPTTAKLKSLISYRKTQFFFGSAETIRPITGWDSGSCSYYEFINMTTGKPVTGVFTIGDNFSKLGIDQQIPDDILVIKHGVSCGRPATALVYANANSIEKAKKFIGLN